MSYDLGFLEDESLTDNFTDGVASKLLKWLEYLAITQHQDFDRMLQFTKALNSAKNSPRSRHGKYLNNIFEMILINSKPESNMLIRYANYLVERGAVHAIEK